MEGEYNGDQLTVELTAKQARILREACSLVIRREMDEVVDRVSETDELEVEDTLLGVSDILTEGLGE